MQGADGTGVPRRGPGTERYREWEAVRYPYDEYHKVPAHTVTYRTGIGTRYL